MRREQSEGLTRPAARRGRRASIGTRGCGTIRFPDFRKKMRGANFFAEAGVLAPRMKTLLLSLTCVTGLVASAGAQVFQPQTARNILVGSIAGAIIGENNDKPLEGALIGAAAGAIWSAATVPSYENRSYAPPVPQAPVYYETSHRSYREPVCRPAPPRVVVVAPPRCDPPRRTVIVQRPVVVDPYCPPPRRVVNRHHHHHRRDVVVCPPAPVCPPRGRVVYLTPGYGWR
jgi:hypothetical protein